MSWTFLTGSDLKLRKRGCEKRVDLLSGDQVFDWWLEAGTGQAKEMSASSSLVFRTSTAALGQWEDKQVFQVREKRSPCEGPKTREELGNLSSCFIIPVTEPQPISLAPSVLE